MDRAIYVFLVLKNQKLDDGHCIQLPPSLSPQLKEKYQNPNQLSIKKSTITQFCRPKFCQPIILPLFSIRFLAEWFWGRTIKTFLALWLKNTAAPRFTEKAFQSFFREIPFFPCLRVKKMKLLFDGFTLLIILPENHFAIIFSTEW